MTDEREYGEPYLQVAVFCEKIHHSATLDWIRADDGFCSGGPATSLGQSEGEHHLVVLREIRRARAT